jgi:hypothetical protein
MSAGILTGITLILYISLEIINKLTLLSLLTHENSVCLLLFWSSISLNNSLHFLNIQILEELDPSPRKASSNVKVHNHFGKVWLFLKKLNIHLLQDPVILFLGICPRKMKAYVHKNIPSLFRAQKYSSGPMASPFKKKILGFERKALHLLGTWCSTTWATPLAPILPFITFLPFVVTSQTYHSWENPWLGVCLWGCQI